MKHTDLDRMVARYSAEAFGCRNPKVTRMWDEGNRNHVDILMAKDAPTQGLCSYATVTLSGHPAYKGGSPLSFGVELLGVSASELFINMMATVAFCICKSKYDVFPGAVFPDVVASYVENVTTKHLVLADPCLWENSFHSREIGDRHVAWLMLLPISHDELTFIEKNGYDQLSVRLAKASVDTADINRESII